LHPQVASADRGEGRGAPLRPGRFAGRDRAGHRRLDGDVGLTRARQGHDGVISRHAAPINEGIRSLVFIAALAHLVKARRSPRCSIARSRIRRLEMQAMTTVENEAWWPGTA